MTLQQSKLGSLTIASEPVSSSPPLADAIAAVARLTAPAILDSARNDLPEGRYTILACNPLATFDATSRDGDPFEQMRRLLAETGLLDPCEPPADAPIFAGGWIGYFAYEAGRFIERLPATTTQDVGLPVARFALYDSAAILDHRTGQWTVAATDFPDSLFRGADILPSLGSSRGASILPALSIRQRLDFWQTLLAQACRPTPSTPQPAAAPSHVSDNVTPQQFKAMVQRARDYIAAGDIFQVNLARRESMPAVEPPIDLYLRLRQTNPGAYNAFLSWGAGILPALSSPRGAGILPALSSSARGTSVHGPSEKPAARPPRRAGFGAKQDGTIVPLDAPRAPIPTSGTRHPAAILSSSPELFLQLTGREVVTRPIKGTRPRSADPAADESLRLELAASPKDRAELAMIVDLQRNDLGRVCDFGTVRVVPDPGPATPYAIEHHPTVHHLVATVTGRLAPGRNAIDLLRACFPGGSITGAPKVRAMEIIDELEPTERSVYTGAIGYFAPGRMTMNIAIRTMIQSAGRLHWYAGGGIVADSQPDAEYDETVAKAAGMRRAVGLV